MSISAVGSSTAYDATQLASTLVSGLDTGKDGSVDKSEFVKGMTSIGLSEDEASTAFDQLDSAKTGKLTQSDFATALADTASSTATPSTTTTISAAAVDKLASESSPSTETPKGGRPSSTGAATTSSSTTQTYDKKDANEDGTVTSQEELIYDLKHVAAAAADKEKTPSSQNAGKQVDETV